MANQTTIEPATLEKAYDGVALRELWGVLSLGFFVLSLTTRFTIRWLPPDFVTPNLYAYRPIVAFLAVPVVSLLGLGCALLADRRQSVTGRLGFFLNITVFGLSFALILLAATFFALR